MAARLTTAVHRRWAHQGFRMLSLSQGIAALELAVASETPQLCVVSVDWQRSVAAAPSPPPLLSEIVQYSPAAETPVQWHDELSRVSAPRRHAFVIERLMTLVRRALSVPGDSAIALDEPIQGMGFDSLMAVELRNELSRATGLVLPATLLFDYPTFNAMAAFLLEAMGMASAAPQGARDAPAVVDGALSASLGEASDVQVEELLNAELERARALLEKDVS